MAVMSGRRSISVDGRPNGIAGGGVVTSFGAIDRLAGVSPMRVAIACSNCARPTPTSISCARVDSSCVFACATSAPDAIPAANRSSVSCSDCSIQRHRASQQIGVRVKAVELEVDLGELRLIGELGVLEICRRRLRGSAFAATLRRMFPQMSA